MIIVEGCDNTGKSTLVLQLMKAIPELRYQKQGPRPPKNTEEYFNELVETLNSPESWRTIVDRFYFSELVYGPILRGGICFSQEQREILEKLMVIRQPYIILCHRPATKIIETFDEREQLDGVKNKVEKIQDRFYEVYKQFEPEFKYMTFYDYGSDSIEELKWGINLYLRRMQPYER